jgi:hypothetical protein
MPDFDPTNRGILGRNRKRRPNSKDPEYAGTLNVDGVEYFLNAWVKEGKYGKFFSVSVKRKAWPQRTIEDPEFMRGGNSNGR